MSINRKQVAARGLVALTAAVGVFEGVRYTVYLDPVGIPTYCFGETSNPEWGKRYSVEECEERLAARVVEFDNAVNRCIGYTPAPGARAAFTSLAYNIGTQQFCGSTLVKKARQFDIAGACAELDRWIYAGGVPWPGLIKRRAEERKMCESSLG